MKWLALYITFCIMAVNSIAQEKIEVNVEQKLMSQGEQTSFTVFIPEANIDFVEKRWKNFINDRPLGDFFAKGGARTIENVYNSISNVFSKEKKQTNKTTLKAVKEKDELIVKNVIHDDVTQEPFDIYAKFTLLENGVDVYNFFRYTDSTFIGKDTDSEDHITTLANYIRTFGVDTYKVFVEEQIDDEEKILKKQNSELKALERKNKSMHNSIGRLESDIEDMKAEIENMSNELPKIKKRITQYKGTSLLHLKKPENRTKKNTKKHVALLKAIETKLKGIRIKLFS